MKRRDKLTIAVALVAALLAVPATAQVKDYKDIKYPKLKEFKIPSPEVYTLDNGMKVFLMEDHELPLISVFTRIRTGSNYEPAETTGLGDLFGQVLREGGTTSMTGDEIDEWLAVRAASIETSIGGDVGFASLNCLKENFDEVFALFSDVLRNPAFAEEKLQVAKVQANTAISRRNDNVGGIVGREFQRLIYGKDSPLARLTEYATIANVSRQDLVEWHKKYYHPNNFYLGVVGDFDSAEMKQKIEKVLGNWKKGPAFNEPEVAYQKEDRGGVYFIEKEDVTQANVRMGHLGINLKNPDYFAVQVMNEVLGGGFASRLFSNVRSEKGLAYSVFGGVGSSSMRKGIFQVGLSTKSGTMAEAVDALEVEVNGIINNPPSTDELNKAKESILNSFVFNYDSKAEILGQQMNYAYFGLPSDFLEKYRANIEKVTGEDVARVAKKYIHPDKMTLLVVGKAEDFDKPVDSFGQVKTVDIAIAPPGDSRPEVTKTAASSKQGAMLVSKMASALSNGSGEKVDSLTADYTMVLDLGGQKMSIGNVVSFVLPDKVRQTMKTPMGNQVIVLNGTDGFMMAGGQSQKLPAEATTDSLKSLYRELLVLAGNSKDPELEAVAAGSSEVDGAPCDLVAVTYRGAESRLCLDSSGRVVKQSWQGKHPMQQTPGLIEVLFSDYREQSGRMLPHKRVMNFEGETFATLTLNTLEVNPEIDEADFEAPN